MATLLQDFAPLSTYAQEQVTREIKKKGLVDFWYANIARFQSHLVKQREAVNHVACFRPSNVGRGSKVKNWGKTRHFCFSLFILYFYYLSPIFFPW